MMRPGPLLSRLLVITAALALLWIWLFDPNFGLINEVLGAVGILGPGWFASPQWALPAMVMTGLAGGVP